MVTQASNYSGGQTEDENEVLDWFDKIIAQAPWLIDCPFAFSSVQFSSLVY